MKLFEVFGEYMIKGADKTKSDIDDIDKKGSKVGETMGKVGSGVAKMGAAVGVAATAAFAVVSKVFSSSVQMADTVQKQAEVYGMTAERIQELTYAGTKLDVSVETILGSQTKLTRAMYTASEAAAGTVSVFDELGIAYKNSDGSLRDSKLVMAEAIDKLGQMTNETERDAMAMKMFGKSAMEMNPLIKAGSGALAELTEEARKTGAVVSNESIAAIDQLGDSFEGLKVSAKGIAGSLSALAVPALTKMTDYFGGLAVKISDAVKTGNWQEVSESVITGITEALNMVVGGITKIMPTVVGLLSSILGMLVKAIPDVLPVILEAVLSLINAFITILSDNGELLIAAASNSIEQFIIGLMEALPQLIPVAVNLIIHFVGAIVDMLPALVPAAIQMIVAIAKGLINAIPKLIEVIPELINSLIVTISINLPLLVKAAVDIIKALVTFLVDNIPLLIDVAINLIMSIVEFLLDPNNIIMLVEAAIEIVIAIAGGLIKAIPKLLESVGKLIWTIVDKFIHYDWAGIGKKILEAIAGALGKFWDWITGKKSVTVNANGTVEEVPAMAAGGTVSRSGRVLVGERGPEYLDLPAGARITPLGRAGGGFTLILKDARIMRPSDVDWVMDLAVRRARQYGVT